MWLGNNRLRMNRVLYCLSFEGEYIGYETWRAIRLSEIFPILSNILLTLARPPEEREEGDRGDGYMFLQCGE